MRLAIGRAFVRLATWIAGACPCERCVRIETNRALMAGLRRHERRQLARRIVSGGPPT